MCVMKIFNNLMNILSNSALVLSFMLCVYNKLHANLIDDVSVEVVVCECLSMFLHEKYLK